ncbi:hypothetical protein QOT17_024565 [Balamuthia mandrillaris]
MELATIDLNSLLHPGNTSDLAMDASSIVVTPEAICVEGLNKFDNDDIEDDDKDKVEPPIMAPILLNYQHTTAFIDSDITSNIPPGKVPQSALKPVDPSTLFEDKHFEVKKVLDHDGQPSDCYYFMKWKEYPGLDNC